MRSAIQRFRCGTDSLAPAGSLASPARPCRCGAVRFLGSSLTSSVERAGRYAGWPPRGLMPPDGRFNIAAFGAFAALSNCVSPVAVPYFARKPALNVHKPRTDSLHVRVTTAFHAATQQSLSKKKPGCGTSRKPGFSKAGVTPHGKSTYGWLLVHSGKNDATNGLFSGGVKCGVIDRVELRIDVLSDKRV